MKQDAIRHSDSEAALHRWPPPHKLIYALVLSAVYAVLILLSNGYDNVANFFIVCFCVSVLPLFGLFPSLVRTFVLLAAGLLVISLVPAGLLQGNYRTFPANLDLTIDVSSPDVPGIEGPQRVTTDARGFRTGNRAVRYEDASPYRVFAIGASTTEQGFLDDSRTWTRLLEKQLSAANSRPVEVINTGVSGLRLVHHLATLDRVEDLNPDLVLFLIGVNDWNRQVTAHFDPQDRFRKSLLSRLRHRFQQSVLYTFYRVYIVLPQRNGLVVRNHRFSSMTDRSRRSQVVRYLPEKVSDDYARDLAQLAIRCRKGAYRCALLTQPTSYYPGAPREVTKYFRLTPPGRSYTLDLDSLIHMADLYNDFSRDMAAKEGLLLCDLAAVMPKGTEAFYDDVHFNTDGARIVAQTLSGCLIGQIPDL